MKLLIITLAGLAAVVTAGMWIFGDGYSNRFSSLKDFVSFLQKDGYQVTVQSQVAPFARNIYKAKEGLILNIGGDTGSCFLFTDEEAWSAVEASQKNIYKQFKGKGRAKADIKTYDNVRCFFQKNRSGA